MKNIIKRICVILITILSLAAVINISISPSVNAAPDPDSSEEETTYTTTCRTLLGMPSWDCGVNLEATNEEDLTKNIVKIAANVFSSITIISAYLVLGFVIYGGYLYMFSSGDVSKATTGRKVLTRAFIGLAIILLSNIILNTIRFALIRDSSLTSLQQFDPNEIVINGINWVIGIAGAVCLIFIIIGAVGFISSTGDPQKLQKSKNTLLYALIGMAIVGLATVITAFVSNTIKDAKNNTGLVNQTIIAKEFHEK